MSRTFSKELRELVTTHGEGRIKWICLDLTSVKAVRKAGKTVSSEFKKIDILVNCAGVALGSTFLMTKLEDFRGVFEINYFNTILLTQIISRKMIRKKSGTIINIVSTAGLFSDKGSLAYGGSKAALIHSTKVLSKELGVYGIRVNGVAPGVVDTEMGAMNDEQAMAMDNLRASLEGKIDPFDVAQMVSFLANNQVSSKITGQIFRVDRGAL